MSRKPAASDGAVAAEAMERMEGRPGETGAEAAVEPEIDRPDEAGGTRCVRQSGGAPGSPGLALEEAMGRAVA
jgi:hypothetical protein